MRLALLLETVQDQITGLADRHSIPPEEVINNTKSIDQLNWKYILNQWYQGNLRLPEDSHRVKEVLSQFDKHKKLLVNKDINQYKRLSDIESAVNTALGKKEESITADLNRPGVNIIQKTGPYVTVEVYDEETLKILGEGTKWCTRGSYPDCQAEEYLNKHGSIDIVFYDGKPLIQYTPDYEQIMDINDNEVTDRELLRKVVAPPDEEIYKEETTKGMKIFKNYLIKVVAGGRNRNIEDRIVDTPKLSYLYAKYALEGKRWPEAEEEISQQLKIAVMYAGEIIRGRWPEIESRVLKVEEYSFLYARDSIGDRWPKAEPLIMMNPQWAYYYAQQVLSGRWPDAEPYIMKDPHWAYLYAKNIIGDRWSEAEPYIMNDPSYAGSYESTFALSAS
jgi:hypothetical protein